jgi:dihydropteroate synthase
LLGASRKKFIGTIGGDLTADRTAGSVAVALHGARQGVQLLRVHDLSATKQALDLEWAINGAV